MIIPEIILRMSSEGLVGHAVTDLRPCPRGAVRPTHPVIIESIFKCPNTHRIATESVIQWDLDMYKCDSRAIT
jgi:hypothetical protein